MKVDLAVLFCDSSHQNGWTVSMNYMCLLPSAHAAHTREQGPLLQNFKHDFPLLTSAWHHHPSSQP
eukprot:scaffold25893_cov115-Amphora_coffeaeformis.AAC.1